MSSVINPEIVDSKQRARAIARVRERGVVMPTFSQLANPSSIPAAASNALADVAPDDVFCRYYARSAVGGHVAIDSAGAA